MAAEDSVDHNRLSGLQASLSAGFTSLQNGEAGAREKLMADARMLVHLLERPAEFIMRTTWAEPAKNSAIEIALDLGVIKALSEASGEVSLDQLATASRADADLLSRILKHLAAMLVVDETGPDRYAANTLTRGLAQPKIGSGITTIMQTAAAPLINMPTYLAELKYKNPVGVVPTPWQAGHGTTDVFYDHVLADPKLGPAFCSYMTGKTETSSFWAKPGFRPLEECLAHPDNDDETLLLVDVGGGLGHDLEAVASSAPALPGRLILEDLASTIAQAEQGKNAMTGDDGPKKMWDPRIRLLAHDFFTPQPAEAKHARAYHMHNVLHNWDDDSCVAILGHLKDAMKPGYSKLLLFECVVPKVGAHWKMTGLDWVMLTNFAAVERTEKQWRSLLARVGLRIEKIYTDDPTTESLIEAVI